MTVSRNKSRSKVRKNQDATLVQLQKLAKQNQIKYSGVKKSVLKSRLTKAGLLELKSPGRKSRARKSPARKSPARKSKARKSPARKSKARKSKARAYGTCEGGICKRETHKSKSRSPSRKSRSPSRKSSKPRWTQWPKGLKYTMSGCKAPKHKLNQKSPPYDATNCIDQIVKANNYDRYQSVETSETHTDAFRTSQVYRWKKLD